MTPVEMGLAVAAVWFVGAFLVWAVVHGGTRGNHD